MKTTCSTHGLRNAEGNQPCILKQKFASLWRHITNWFRSKSALILGGLIVSAASSHAQGNVPDGSFEGVTASVTSPTLLTLSTNSGSLGFWTATVGGMAGSEASVAAGTSVSLGGPVPNDGSYLARLSLPAGGSASLALSQTLGDSFLANSLYTLSFDLDQGTSAGLLGGTTVELRAGSSTVASLSGSELLTLLDANDGFQTLNLTYQSGGVAPVGNIGLFIGADSVAGVGGNVFVDNFQLGVTPVPEPSPLALGGMSALIIGLWRKRSRAV